MFLLLLAGLWRVSAADTVVFDFTSGASTLDWEATHDVDTLGCDAAGLGIPILGPDPYVTSPPLEPPPSDRGLLQLELRLKSEVGGAGQIFFGDPAMESNSVRFVVRTNAWTDVCLPLPSLGPRTRLRLDPPGTNGLCRLAWLRVVRPDGVGIQRVTATADEIEIDVSGLARGGFDLVALAPEQTLSDAVTAPPLASAADGAGSALRLPRFFGPHSADRLWSAFVVRTNHPRHGAIPMGPPHWVHDFRGASKSPDPFPVAASKKGLQVQMVDDATALGVKHAALNVDLTALADLEGRPDSYVHLIDGEQFRFRRAPVDAIPVKPLSDAGAVVTLILLAYESGDPGRDAIFLHPRRVREMPNRLAAFNTRTPDGIRWFRATVSFLAERFSLPGRPSGSAVNFIIGNEVTAHWYWANMGEVAPDEFVADYVRMVRMAHTAIRRASATARVYVSLDHHWNLIYGGNPRRAIAGRWLIDEFNRRARLEGDFEWHIAYHPYPEDLFNARTWQDRTALDVPESPRITFKNLPVLTRYLDRPEIRRNGRPRRVILSEQGFHSGPSPESEQLQAAAYAYAWTRVSQLDGIDAFILHRHVDHAHEGGLNLGLWRRRAGSVSEPGERKPIYEVFRLADTERRAAAFEFALPLIGITRWDRVNAD
jgi:hypothetical protein